MKTFKKLNLAILALTYLKHYNAALETCIKINTFDEIILKILLQKHGKHWYLIIFLFKIMAPAELNYNIHNKKMLAIMKLLAY